MAFRLATDGEILLAIDVNHTVRLWHIPNGNELGPRYAGAGEEARAISPDGKLRAITESKRPAGLGAEG